MDNLKITYNPALDKYKDVILFPSKYQSAVEVIINVPLPGEKPLLPVQKITILLEEIERVNQHIELYKIENNQPKVVQFLTMKESFVELLQQIMNKSFQVSFYKNAA